MAFLDFLKREDGSWNIGLIMALVVACLTLLGGGYAVYYRAAGADDVTLFDAENYGIGKTTAI